MQLYQFICSYVLVGDDESSVRSIEDLGITLELHRCRGWCMSFWYIAPLNKARLAKNVRRLLTVLNSWKDVKRNLFS